MSHIIVTGVPNDGTSALPPPRLEINDLVNNEKHFSLFIQALQRMYATSQSKSESHFQLGGIHGIPVIPWEGAGSRPVAGTRFGGYCTHGTVLFPTWHRPYLAIYEQILNKHATDIAQTYTVDNAAWVEAAKQLRIPYWDWAVNAVPPVQVISSAQVNITAPNGQRISVANPLLAYRFNPIDPSFPAPYSRWPTTLRHPHIAGPNARSDVDEMIDRGVFAFAAANAPSISASAKELVSNTPATHAAPMEAMRLFAMPAAAQAPLAEPSPTTGSTYTDWAARIHVNKYITGSSFSVLIFLGPVPEDPAQWRTCESYVGAQHVFVNGSAEECENCRGSADSDVEGFVQLNRAIAARSGLDSFDPDVVEPYLKEHLAWRILKVDRSSYDVADAASLQVIVIATPLGFENGATSPHAQSIDHKAYKTKPATLHKTPRSHPLLIIPHHLVHTSMSQHAVVTGVPRTPAQSTAPPRREINDLVKDKMQFSLFIQALQAMYQTSQKDDLSHFGFGGIHGLPFQRWETSGPGNPVGRWGGYCTHGSVLFPTWHRPYLAAYEQVLQGFAVKIAATYTTPDKTQWANAALNLRLPFWDWATNAVPPTQVISDATVTITTPNGQQTSVKNPLLAYPFNPIDRSFPSPYSRWPTTLRHPTSEGSGATSNVREMISDLQSDANDIRSQTYNLLTRVTTWPAFSNHTPGDGGSSSSSLEAIHDGIHVDVGADGHMGDPAVAAFDPIFFLHHANVDRLLALWGALNPNTWVSTGPANGGTWTISGNATETATSDLTPFWNGASTYWNSNACRNFDTSLNYTYPEFVGLQGQDANTVRTKIGAIVNQLYGGSTRRNFAFATAGAQGATGQSIAAAAQSILNVTQHTDPAPPAAMQLFATPASTPAAASSLRVAPHTEQVHVEISGGGQNKFYEWSARVHAKKFELGGSYSILIFLGQVPDDPKQWRSAPSYVGAQHVFANSQMEDCENCRRNATENVEGFVALNSAIAAHSGLNSFDPQVVEPYLKKELSWRVQKVDRSAVDLSQLPSLQIVVVALPLQLHHGEMFPKAGTPVHHHGITEGRPGGHHTASS
ncbi:hypothetical protein FRB90_008451 [Tulasnella sp. 427]|nr:hypothetical protein FRB90_008451 [Tulasnella sp. 427]